MITAPSRKSASIDYDESPRAARGFSICNGLELFFAQLRHRPPSPIATGIVIDLIDEQMEKHGEGQAKYAEQDHGYFSHCGCRFSR
jgi:hypothetical protein